MIRASPASSSVSTPAEVESKLESNIETYRNEVGNIVKPSTQANLVIRLENAHHIITEKSNKGVYVHFQMGKNSVQSTPKKDTTVLEWSETLTLPVKSASDELKIAIKEKAFMKDTVIFTAEIRDLGKHLTGKLTPLLPALTRQNSKKGSSHGFPTMNMKIVCEGFGVDLEKVQRVHQAEAALRDKIYDAWFNIWRLHLTSVHSVNTLFKVQLKEETGRREIDRLQDIQCNQIVMLKQKTAPPPIGNEPESTAIDAHQRPLSRQTAGTSSTEDMARLQRELAELQGENEDDTTEVVDQSVDTHLQTELGELAERMLELQQAETSQREGLVSEHWSGYQQVCIQKERLNEFIDLPNEETNARRRLIIAENSVFASITRQSEAAWSISLLRTKMASNAQKVVPSGDLSLSDDDDDDISVSTGSLSDTSLESDSDSSNESDSAEHTGKAKASHSKHQPLDSHPDAIPNALTDPSAERRERLTPSSNSRHGDKSDYYSDITELRRESCATSEVPVTRPTSTPASRKDQLGDDITATNDGESNSSQTSDVDTDTDDDIPPPQDVPIVVHNGESFGTVSCEEDGTRSSRSSDSEGVLETTSSTNPTNTFSPTTATSANQQTDVLSPASTVAGDPMSRGLHHVSTGSSFGESTEGADVLRELQEMQKAQDDTEINSPRPTTATQYTTRTEGTETSTVGSRQTTAEGTRSDASVTQSNPMFPTGSSTDSLNLLQHGQVARPPQKGESFDSLNGPQNAYTAPVVKAAKNAPPPPPTTTIPTKSSKRQLLTKESSDSLNMPQTSHMVKEAMSVASNYSDDSLNTPQRHQSGLKVSASSTFNYANPVEMDVIVESASHLEGEDFGGKSDPYVVLTFAASSIDSNEDVKYKTHTVKKTVDPTWSKRFRISTKLGDTLRLEVFDEDCGSKDDFLGRTQLLISKTLLGELAAMPEATHTEMLQLLDKKNRPTKAMLVLSCEGLAQQLTTQRGSMYGAGDSDSSDSSDDSD